MSSSVRFQFWLGTNWSRLLGSFYMGSRTTTSTTTFSAVAATYYWHHHIWLKLELGREPYNRNFSFLNFTFIKCQLPYDFPFVGGKCVCNFWEVFFYISRHKYPPGPEQFLVKLSLPCLKPLLIPIVVL